MRKYCKRIKIPITKYNPVHRDNIGGYMKEEWTSISDIGNIYNNKKFTFDEYSKFENLYVDAVFLILNFFKSKKFKVTHILKFQKKNQFNNYESLKLYPTYQKLHKDMVIKEKNDVAEIVRLRLREHIAELELTIDVKSKTEILFGFDYYMYLKTNKDVAMLLSQIRNLGLFTE
jgi:hypothetical protein